MTKIISKHAPFQQHVQFASDEFRLDLEHHLEWMHAHGGDQALLLEVSGLLQVMSKKIDGQMAAMSADTETSLSEK